ncbi:MAG TPA: TetR family transcriptional regulator [Actinomycetaceae bacterium]|nr:TetR family transcriptional regulator [Actinomycetaceae bacterium]
MEENANRAANTGEVPEPADSESFTDRGNVTRARILHEAISAFERAGYHGATLRDIANAADVDLALLAYYFGNKAGLFAAAIASVFEPLVQTQELVDSDRANAGTQVTELLAEVMLGKGGNSSAVGVLRTLLTPANPPDEVRELVASRVRGLVETVVGPDRSPRYTLLVAEFVGLVVFRLVVPLEPVASASSETVMGYLSRRLQAILDSIPVVPSA